MRNRLGPRIVAVVRETHLNGNRDHSCTNLNVVAYDVSRYGVRFRIFSKVVQEALLLVTRYLAIKTAIRKLMRSDCAPQVRLATTM